MRNFKLSLDYYYHSKDFDRTVNVPGGTILKVLGANDLNQLLVEPLDNDELEEAFCISIETFNFLAKAVNERVNAEPAAESISFDDFWKIYPKRSSKAPAKKKWDKMNVTAELFAKITEHLSIAYHLTDKQYIPLPTTYLNQERWNDEVAGLLEDDGEIPYMDIKDLWNKYCPDLVPASQMTPDRKAALDKLWNQKDDSGAQPYANIEFYKRWFYYCNSDDWYRGQEQGQTGDWKADLEFCLSYERIIAKQER